MTQSKTNAAEWIEGELLPYMSRTKEFMSIVEAVAIQRVIDFITMYKSKWQSEAPTCDCRYKQNTVCDICQGIGGADKPTGAGWTNYESITVFGAREPKQYVPIGLLQYKEYTHDPLSELPELKAKINELVVSYSEIIQRLTRAGI